MMTSAANTTQNNHTPSYDATGQTPTVRSSILWGILVVVLTLPLLGAFTTVASIWVVRASAWLVVIAWAWSVHEQLQGRVPSMRWWWTLGCGWQWLHVAIAFHVVHAWSHQTAWEHTRQLGGVGDGIYINYVFSIAWLLDCVWMWCERIGKTVRLQWWRWGLQLFMGFILFQATVIFGTSIGRMLGVMTVVGLVISGSRRR
jgi:hypothetical protein